MPKVVIYRSRLLPWSETFVRQHYESLPRYEPTFVGLRALNEQSLEGFRTVVHGGSNWELARFRLSGKCPRFEAEIARIKPDLIHAHFGVDAIDMIPVARRLGVPLVVTLHGYDVTLTRLALAKSAEGAWYLLNRRRLWREATTALPVADHLAKRAVALGCPEEKVRTHHLGLDLKPFAGQVEQPRKGVLFVGRLVEKKGLPRLVEALVSVDPDIPLTIIGDGPMREHYVPLAKRALANVTYLGAQPHERVRLEVARAEVLVLPSLSAKSGDNEGLPIVLLEAAASKTPVLSFDQGGMRDAVVNGKTGVLVPPGDVEALAGGIRSMLHDPDKARRLGEAARAYVENDFDIRAQAAQLEMIYDQAVARPNRATNWFTSVR